VVYVSGRTKGRTRNVDKLVCYIKGGKKKKRRDFSQALVRHMFPRQVPQYFHLYLLSTISIPDASSFLRVELEA
jgi:hypothetical protein